MPKQNTEHKDAIQDAQAQAGDEFDKDLERANHRAGGGSALGNLPDAPRDEPAATSDSATVTSSDADTDQGGSRQHSRKGQAQSPVEQTPNQPEPRREGHHGGARDS